MFKIGEIRELIRLLDETSVSELTVESGDAKLHIKKPDAPVTMVSQAPVMTVSQPSATTVETVPVAATAAEPVKAEQIDDSTTVITSPMVGTFYRASSPDAPPYVEEGSRVTAKTIVCIVEAMKLMNEIEAEINGVIVEVLAENGQLVEYGQPLFRVKHA
ncbi:acetyl-CoA carboxylase biotin carboxyl carrier protein [Alicyclobacillus mengziensis]|uniref:Biotin carboxyl carrier protein of acetyl-CoA carboxylase n=1 Tax=Alicyclobacillus mengziensis TaxID=2931921 RepID=A0A9X7VVZ2_9BACL|nr:acetyl-CoA carboxylase biotin carboxyl carrier protein [Alicyclobacillus mengziensis]QSO45880.1 acetyl-CoA carboxylase biotin carboxyl carrier protein [Alicyclobacillus mengziensis]